MNSIKIDDLASEIMQGLTEYSDLAEQKMEKAVRKTARSVKAEIMLNSPKKTGEYAAGGRTDVLICVGKLCKNMYDAAQNVENSATELHYFEDKAQMLSALDRLLKNGDTVLVKASHGMGFDEVVKKLSE